MVTRETLREWLMERTEEDGDCWLWRRSLNSGGVPVATVNGMKSKTVRSLVFALQGGDSTGLCVIPLRCSDPLCVRPEHQVAVTRAQCNAWLGELGRFSTVRSRTVHAEAGRKRSRLTMADAKAIRAMRARDMTLAQIAEHWPVSTGTISKICRGERWRDYGDPMTQLALQVTR